MCTQECKQALNNTVEAIVQPFKNNGQLQAQKIISCFYNCCNKEFVKWAMITYKGYPVDFIESLANMAFTDTVITFSEKAAAGKIYQDKATIRTILFGIYRYKILEQLKKEKRIADKKEKYAAENNETISNPENAGTGKESLYKILEQALAKMDTDDRQIIIWRHIEEKKCDEIAAILAINKSSATNRIYRCMERLRNLAININKSS
jgi:RNA polymerase sigma factor (sigma-70 family)